MTVQGVILVGVDGSQAAWSALQWAATEADATGRRLLVAHVSDVRSVEGTVDPEPFGRSLLAEAIAALAATHPRVAVTTELLSGDPARALIDLVEDAEIVAVGRGRRGLPGLLLGTVAFRVLAHSSKPTAVIAAGTRASANAIVVGVSDSAGGAAALRFAFEEAQTRGAQLVAVRSWSERDWRLAVGAALPLTTPNRWEAEERTRLDDCLRPFRSSFPSVPVHPMLSS